jgi:hypothetical protein
MFHQAVDFVQGLEWPNDIQYFRFMTVLSKVIGKALEQYTTTIETMFIADMYPRTENESQISYGISFYNRARTQLIGGRMRKDNEPFDFTAQVKLNCEYIKEISCNGEKLTMQYDLFFRCVSR